MLKSCHDPLPHSFSEKPTNSNFDSGVSAFGTPQQVALRSQIVLAEVRHGMNVERPKSFRISLGLSRSLHYILREISNVPAD